MQKRLDKIDVLIKEGYTLKRNSWYDIQFQKCSGNRININLPWKSPGGFSWIAFWFPGVVCCQIREWSYFKWIAVITCASVIFSAVLGSDSTTAGGLLLSIFYGCWFPYMRYMAIKEERDEFSVLTAFFLSIVLTVVAVIPSGFLALILGYEGV